jgi:hypothetical protein
MIFRSCCCNPKKIWLQPEPWILQIGPRKLQIGPWRHGRVVEKLPMEEKGGENHWRTSPRLGKDDSETLKLRELNNGGDRTWISLPGVEENPVKNSLTFRRWKESWRWERWGWGAHPWWPPGPGRPAPAPGDEQREQGAVGRSWSREKETREEEGTKEIKREGFRWPAHINTLLQNKKNLSRDH